MTEFPRHKTNPGLGYVHTEDHCDLCASQVAWCIRELEGYATELAEQAEAHKSAKVKVEELVRKRRESEVRNAVKDERARFWLKIFGVVATGGVAPWVWKLAKFAVEKAGG